MRTSAPTAASGCGSKPRPPAGAHAPAGPGPGGVHGSEIAHASVPSGRVEPAEEVGPVLERLGCGPADSMVSGIPFSTMPEELRDRILRATRSALKPDGVLLVYQFSGKLHPHLQRVFPRVDRGFEPRNVLPAWLFCARQAARDH